MITIETQHRTCVRRANFVFRCERCAVATAMLTPVEAAQFCRTTVREIFRRLGAGELHFLEIDSNVIYICRRSLAESFN